MYSAEELVKHPDFVDNTAVPVEKSHAYVVDNDGHKAHIILPDWTAGVIDRDNSQTPRQFLSEIKAGGHIWIGRLVRV